MITKIVVGAFAAYAMFCLGMFLAQDAFLFHPSREQGPPEAFGLTGFQRVTFDTEDGVGLVGWLHENPAHDKAVVYFYGNADALANYADFFHRFTDAGYSVLGVNYRGYGGSAGRPSEAGFYKDADAALRFMTRYVPVERVTVIGRSIGSGVAVALAARNRVGTLVLISPFTSVTDAAAAAFWYLPVRQLLRSRFPSIDIIRDVKAPVLIVHGDADTLVPVSQGERLYEAANEPKRLEIFKGADHIFMDLNRIFELAVAFDGKSQGS